MATCEMCGKVVENTVVIRIAGTNMKSCNSCKSMGKEAEQSKNLDYKHSFIKKKRKEELILEVKPNYASLINSTLAKKGLNVHQLAMALNLKESTLNQYLSGKIRPDILTAKKIENFLEIKLLEEREETDISSYISEDEPSDSQLSLGDLLKKKMESKK